MTSEAAVSGGSAAKALRRKRLALFLLCFGPPFLYLICFMILPYGNVFQYSFWKKELYTVAAEFNWENYARVWTNPLYRTVLFNSLEVAAIVTVCANLIGYPLAYFLAFVARKHRTLLYFLVIAPLWTSFLLRVFVWKLILGVDGIINGVLIYIGLIDEPMSIIIYNRFSVCLTLVYIFIPFVALPVYAALEKIPREYVEASMDLGAGRWRTFVRVILPLSIPGVIAGSIFTFCLSFGDFVTPTLLGGPSGIMIGNIIIGQFGAAFDWPFGSALAVVILLVVLAMIALAAAAEPRAKARIA